jgi:L-threonylcarbamoyladenylate synthase
LGCDINSAAAVNRILSMKQRHQDQGLIIVAAAVEQFSDYLGQLRADQREWLDEIWPGPTTVLVPHLGRCPDYLCGVHETLALRVSAHPVVSGLCYWMGSPLVSTSANRSGKPSLMSSEAVMTEFAGEIDFLIPGPLGGQLGPSEIVDLNSRQILRPRVS